MQANPPSSESTPAAVAASDVWNQRVVGGTLLRRCGALGEIANDDLHPFLKVRSGDFGAGAVVDSESDPHGFECQRVRILSPHDRALISSAASTSPATTAAPGVASALKVSAAALAATAALEASVATLSAAARTSVRAVAVDRETAV